MENFLRAKFWVIITLGCLIVGSSEFVHAQTTTLPPNQPEQDACDALMICGNSFTTPYSYQGTGQILDIDETPCQVSPTGGEVNSMWLRLEVNTAGIIVFTIAPISYDDDYDFAVLDITNRSCDSLDGSSTGNVIRCNFNNNNIGSNVNGVIGVSTTGTLPYVAGGSTGNSFLSQINANAGDVYLIMINNFGNYVSGGPSQGFTIDFTGSTATFNQPDPPNFASVVPTICEKKDSITIDLTTNILCNSIAADGSDFYLTPAGNIQSAHGIGCTSGGGGTAGYTNKVTVVFSSPLANGDYYLRAKTGTDGNTLMNFCDAALPTPDSLGFHVGADPIPLVGLDSPACQTLRLELSAPVSCASITMNGSEFSVTGPSAVSVNSATGVGCTAGGYTETIEIQLAQPISVDGLYTLSVQTGGDGNTMVDSCGRYVLDGASLNFRVNSYNGQLIAHPDTSLCPGSVTLYPENHGTPPTGGFQYTWSPSAGLSNPNQTNPTATIDTGYHRYIAATVDTNGCFLRDSVVVRGFQGPSAQFSFSVNPGCEGDTVFFENESWNANKYLWKFGLSGLTDTSENPQFLYPDVGSYSVTLIAQNDHCTDSTMQLVSVGHPLAADFIVSNDTICQGTQVNFTNQSTVTAIGSQSEPYQWDFGDGSASNLEHPSYTFNNSGAYWVRLVVSDSIPCYDTATHLIIVDSISGLNVNVSDTPICKGDKITFTANYSDNGISYLRWGFGDSQDSVLNQNPVSHAYDEAGIYTVSVYNHYRACPDTAMSFDVRIKDIPLINLGADTSLCLDGEPFEVKDQINAGNSTASWLWNTGDTTSSIIIKHPGEYWATVSIDYCSATDDITVEKDCYMDVPNSFTPNGDGQNDYFFPRQKLAEGVVSFKMVVYNRWGQKLFETNNTNGRGWDGRFNGEMQPVGVYIYMIDVVYKNGRTESYKGNVTLVR